MIRLLVLALALSSCGYDPEQEIENQKEIAEMERELEHEKKKKQLQEEYEEEEQENPSTVDEDNINVNVNVNIGDDGRRYSATRLSYGDTQEKVLEILGYPRAVEDGVWYYNKCARDYGYKLDCSVTISNYRLVDQDNIEPQYLDLRSW